MKSLITLSIALLLAACDHDGDPARFNPEGVQSIAVPEPVPLLLLGLGVAVVLVVRRMRR